MFLVPFIAFFNLLEKRVGTHFFFNTTNYWKEFEYKFSTGDFYVLG